MCVRVGWVGLCVHVREVAGAGARETRAVVFTRTQSWFLSSVRAAFEMDSEIAYNGVLCVLCVCVYVRVCVCVCACVCVCFGMCV